MPGHSTTTDPDVPSRSLPSKTFSFRYAPCSFGVSHPLTGVVNRNESPLSLRLVQGLELTIVRVVGDPDTSTTYSFGVASKDLSSMVVLTEEGHTRGVVGSVSKVLGQRIHIL